MEVRGHEQVKESQRGFEVAGEIKIFRHRITNKLITTLSLQSLTDAELLELQASLVRMLSKKLPKRTSAGVGVVHERQLVNADDVMTITEGDVRGRVLKGVGVSTYIPDVMEVFPAQVSNLPDRVGRVLANHAQQAALAVQERPEEKIGVVEQDHPDIQDYINRQFERIEKQYKDDAEARGELRDRVGYRVARMFFDVAYDDLYTRKQLDEFFEQFGMTFDEAMTVARSGS